MGRIILPEPIAATPAAATAVTQPVAAPPAAAETAPAVASDAVTEVVAEAVAAIPPTPEEVSKLQRAQKAAMRANDDARRHRDAVARQSQQQAENAQLRAELDRLRGRANLADELEGLSRTDKIAAARRLGISPREVIEAATAEGTPEAANARLRAEIAKEFEDKYGSRLVQQQQFIDNMSRAQQQQAVSSAESNISKAAADAKRYPFLSEQPPLIVLELVRNIVGGLVPAERDELTRNLFASTPERQSEVIGNMLGFLESRHAEHKQARSAQTSSAGSTVTSPNEQAGTSQPRTQTNGATGTPDATPPDFEKWSDRKQNQWMAEQLKKRKAVTQPKTATK